MKYKIDKECISLCEALNAIPGVETYESCCGHGKESFMIFLRVDRVSALFWLGRAMSQNYGCPKNWRCILECTDFPLMHSFMITSNEVRGQDAYNQANVLAATIIKNLSNETLKRVIEEKV